MSNHSFGKSITGGLNINYDHSTDHSTNSLGRVIKRPNGLVDEINKSSVKVYKATRQHDSSPKNRTAKDTTFMPNATRPESTDTKVPIKENIGKAPSDYDLAKILVELETIAIIENQVCLGHKSRGYFIGLAGNDADTSIRKCIPEKLKKYVSSKNVKEILNWLKTFDHLKVTNKKLKNKEFYVNCLNYVIDIRDFSVHDKSLNFYFNSEINSNYPVEYRSHGDHFEKFMDDITKGNLSIYRRIQEVFGYILCDIRNLKHIFFFLGPKDCGKSILINLLVELIGKEFTSNLSLHDFNSQFRLSRLYKKKLNCYGETSEDTLSRLDIIKAASGGDQLTGEFKFENCFEFINKAALLFAGNHLPKLKVVDQNNAFSERLLIVPFVNQIPKEDQDVHLLQKLLSDKPYITKWAIEGINRLIRQGYKFSSCEMIDEIQTSYSRNNNTVQVFVSECCDLDPYLRSHTYELEEAYHNYCFSIGEPPLEGRAFHNSLKSIPGILNGRFRIDGENLNGYYGIALKEVSHCHPN